MARVFAKLKAVEFKAPFNIWYVITFAIFWEGLWNYLKKNFFRSLTLVSENTPKVISIGPLITEKRSFKKLKILSVWACFISKIKKPDILDFSSIKYFAKRLFLNIWNLRVNYCGNYGPSNLLFCFTGRDLEKLNNRQGETAVNSLVRCFES